MDRWPNFNWKEIELMANQMAPELEGLFVDRIVVPERPHFPQGYLKGEWIIRFSGQRRERGLVLSARARHPYFALLPDQGPNAASSATRSPFDLAVSKQLKGLKLLKLHALDRERLLLLDFQGDLRLVLFLVPSTPEALLVQRVAPLAWKWPVIVRSRTIRDNPEAASFFEVPDASRAPENPPIRQDLVQSDSLPRALEGWLDQEAFGIRTAVLDKQLREKSKTARDRVRQSEVALAEAEQEPDWQRYGDLLKSAIGTISEEPRGAREVTDFESGGKVTVPCDPKLGLRNQIEKFYQHARRKQRRMLEAKNRILLFGESLAKLDAALLELRSLDPMHRDWKVLERLERALGSEAVRSAVPVSVSVSVSVSAKRKSGGWLGKSFESRDGLPIWVGRNRDENLELTFRHARGNDLWMHVRGRPGSHVVIPVQPGKSVPLETLLDAANLVIYYSGGENWGKTEVDYAYKKYVRRIKDSTEASYTNNRTLIVEPDRSRLKRLLGSADK